MLTNFLFPAENKVSQTPLTIIEEIVSKLLKFLSKAKYILFFCSFCEFCGRFKSKLKTITHRRNDREKVRLLGFSGF
jgi:hypothetical protein